MSKVILSAIFTFCFINNVFAAKPTETTKIKESVGKVYAIDSDKKNLLFNFERKSTVDGDKESVTRVFTDAKNVTEVVKTEVEYKNGTFLKASTNHMQLGTVGKAEVRGGRVYFELKKKNGKIDKDDEKFKANTVVNDGIIAYLHNNWEKLLKGKDVDVRLVVLSRLETVGFTYTKEKETNLNGKPVIIVKMAPKRLIIKALVDPIYFTFDAEGEHRCLEVKGRTTPKIKKGDKWVDIDAHIVYKDR